MCTTMKPLPESRWWSYPSPQEFPHAPLWDPLFLPLHYPQAACHYGLICIYNVNGIIQYLLLFFPPDFYLA